MALLNSEMCLDNAGAIGTALAKTESGMTYGTVQVPLPADQNKEKSPKKRVNAQNKSSNRGRSKMTHNNKTRTFKRCLSLGNLNNKDTKLITDDMLKQKAEAIAKQLGLQNFSCSPHWLETFKRQFNLIKPTHTGAQQQVLPPHIDYSHAIAEQGSINVMAPVSLAETHRALTTAIAYLAERPSPVNRSSITILQKMIEDITKDAKLHAREPTHTVTTASGPGMQIQQDALTAQTSVNVPFSAGNVTNQNTKHVSNPSEASHGETSWISGRPVNGVTIT